MVMGQLCKLQYESVKLHSCMEVQHLELSPAERDFYDTLWRKAKTERRPKRLLLRLLVLSLR